MPLTAPLPAAAEFRAFLTAARDCGVTKLELGADGSLRFEMAAVTPGERIVEQINASAGADPIDVIRRAAANGQERPPVRDLLEMAANGVRFVPVNGDPTQAD